MECISLCGIPCLYALSASVFIDPSLHQLDFFLEIFLWRLVAVDSKETTFVEGQATYNSPGSVTNQLASTIWLNTVHTTVSIDVNLKNENTLALINNKFCS